VGTKSRVAFTLILSAVSALEFYAYWKNGETEPAFAHGTVYKVLLIATVAGIPLLVGRWWIALAIAGPLGFLIFWQITGHHVYADGGAEPLNVESIFAMLWYVVWWEILTAARKGGDKLWAWWPARRTQPSDAGASEV
jgi:hypothetical protein